MDFLIKKITVLRSKNINEFRYTSKIMRKGECITA